MSDAITPRPEGRPTALDEPTIQKLEEILRLGGKIIAACSYAKISPQTYYSNLKTNREFLDRMTSAQHYSVIAARSIVMKQMMNEKEVPADERTKLAQWWLEKHDMKPTEGPVQNTQVNIFTSLKDKYTKQQEDVTDADVQQQIEEDLDEQV